jgi:hypothetical protein
MKYAVKAILVIIIRPFIFYDSPLPTDSYTLLF